MVDEWSSGAQDVADHVEESIFKTALDAIERGDLRALFLTAKQVFALPLADKAEISSRASKKFGRDFSKSDWKQALREAEAEYKSQERRERVASSERPRIRLNGRQLVEVTRECAAALVAANDPPQLFWRQGEMVRIRRHESGAPLIEPVEVDFLMLHLSRAADFYRGSETEVSCDPTKTVALSILSLDPAELALPPLVGVSQIPLFRADGSVHDEPGYDASTRHYFSPTCDIPPVPNDLESDDVAAAVEAIEDVLVDFPFDSQSSKANAFAMLLLPLIRNVVVGPTPLACIEAPSPGSGKSMLATICSVLATGETAAIAWKTEDRENEVTITSALRESKPVVVLDNVTGLLGSGSLCAALTASEMNIRPMGQNRLVTVQVRSAWIATANNINLGEDMARRVYKIRIDAKMAAPMQRSGFRHPQLIDYVQRNRGRLVHALMVIGRWWFQCKRPLADVVPLGSFESWHVTLASVLKCAGVDGFMLNLSDVLGRDQSSEQWATLMEALHSRFEDIDFSVSDVIGDIKETGSALREAIPEWMPRENADQLRKSLAGLLGRKALHRIELDGKQVWIEPAGKRHNAKTWRVMEA